MVGKSPPPAAPRGFVHVLTRRHDVGEILDAIGTRWELAGNAYKPYPCGIVVRAVMEGCTDS